MEIAKGIHRIGTGLVNVYLIEEGGEVTIIDAGVPGYWGDLPAALGAMGSSLDKVRSVVLTHGHPDHVGFAERMRRENHTPIRVHELDAALARGEVPNPAKGFGQFKIVPMLSFLVWGVRHGGLGMKPIREVVTFGDGATLDVPGSPRVILVPGHTPGSAALHVASRGVLFVGDAMATRSVMTGVTGPQMAPFTADPEQALESLARLEGIDAATVLPGHGEPWTGGVDEAIRRVRTSAPRAG
jgi:glyoxylase-like metal-dependent hydrolase (beta-lactamase superfamily II)